MLEVKNLRKTYRTKNGVVTNALDGVSLNFPENGMVFILGKSGSGKSTLLNVCGGLDRADSGEIIIKGKSSAEFSGPDFDSYRNTFVGFVFQEYNILDEFTVEDNIALALELQNKKRDPAVIRKILEDVEMTQFATRKPNTLSGGQKQRVAIARALVKEPQIIMADEPTGALDSATGKQVFDTLKKLSKEKLVLVISHDRDFAEQYADRIIELKDGKVISDQTRVETEGVQNVRFYGSDVVCVSDGAALTDDDMLRIKNFLNKSGGSAVISTARENIAQMKHDRPEISAGDFQELTSQPEPKSYPAPKMIRSHLPLRHAVKMGASGLKVKPVRLVFTILLSVVAFILFGLASTLMLFDGKSVSVQSLKDGEYEHIILEKAYWYTRTSYYDGKVDEKVTTKGSSLFTQAEFDGYREKYHGAIAAYSDRINIENISMTRELEQFYTSSADGVIMSDPSLELVTGRLPQKNNEIAISSFFFEGLKNNGAVIQSETVEGEKTELEIKKVEDLISNGSRPVYISVYGKDRYEVVGVFKSAKIPSAYSKLKEAADKGMSYDEKDWLLPMMWYSMRSSGLYAYFAVTQEEFLKYKPTYSDYVDPYEYFATTEYPIHLRMIDYDESTYHISKYKDNRLELYDFDGDPVEALDGNEIGLSFNTLGHLYNNAFQSYKYAVESEEMYSLLDVINKAKDDYYADHPAPDKADYTDDDGNVDNDAFELASYKREIAASEAGNLAGQEASELKAYYDYVRAEMNASIAEYEKSYPEPTGTDEWYAWYQNKMSYAEDMFAKNNIFAKLETAYDTTIYKAEDVKLLKPVKQMLDAIGVGELMIDDDSTAKDRVSVGGVYLEYSSGMYMSDSLYDKYYTKPIFDSEWTSVVTTKYKEASDAYIKYIFVPYDGSHSLAEKFVDMSYKRDKNDDSSVNIANYVIEQINLAESVVKVLEKAFLIAGLVFAVFAFLLMFNFISTSISAKKKEIGILRALGARTSDVFKIFMSEAGIIALICFIISTLGSIGICAVLNNIITEGTVVSASLLVFGPLSVLCVFAIAAVTATLSTILPVAIYSRKPPVDSIRAL